MSNLEAHADRELRRLGISPDAEAGPAKWMYDNIMELISVFSAQGHSGSSGPWAVDIFNKVGRFAPLSPLTGEEDEWRKNVLPGVDQNIRCSHVFRSGGIAYDSEAVVFRDTNGVCFTNADSRREIIFPYTPTKTYVAVEPRASWGA